MAASDDYDSAADRLEAAVERIAALVARRAEIAPGPSSDLADIARQLDGLIKMVNGALAGSEPHRVTGSEPELDQG